MRERRMNARERVEYVSTNDQGLAIFRALCERLGNFH
jgi:hypothetical protein